MRIGTRGSKLALAQANRVKDAIIRSCQVSANDIEIIPITTSGDKIQNKDLSTVGGKGLFIKELEEQLLLDNIDIAVHSTKDIPAYIPEDLTIAAFLKRDAIEDVFVSKHYSSFEALPQGALLGTASPRRRLQVYMVRPDLKTVLFRGNVETRLQKLSEGLADATILAACGLDRLGIDLKQEGFYAQILPKDRFIPAIGQGIISVECRKKDSHIIKMLDKINDRDTKILALAERGYLETLKGNCKTPMAAYAEYVDNKIMLYCMLANDEGTKVRTLVESGDVSEPYKVGYRAAKAIQKLLLL
jgi:hydroxymethylbilane synthase